MIGPILLAVSWVLLRLEGKGLRALGFDAPRRRLAEFAAGMLVAAAAVAIQQLGLAAATGVAWQLEPDYTGALAVEQLRWNVNSVLYEELLFRGYLLYQAVRLLGARRAVLLDAAVFGVYHWFSYGVLGQIVPMVFVFLLTASFGLMLALAFTRTGSVAAPIGLHFGWNSVSYMVFSGGPQGAGLLTPSDGSPPLQAPGLAGLGLSIGVPLALAGLVSWYLVKRRPMQPGGSPGGR